MIWALVTLHHTNYNYILAVSCLECECSLHNFNVHISEHGSLGTRLHAWSCVVGSSSDHLQLYSSDLNHFPISVERFLHLRPSKEGSLGTRLPCMCALFVQLVSFRPRPFWKTVVPRLYMSRSSLSHELNSISIVTVQHNAKH